MEEPGLTNSGGALPASMAKLSTPPQAYRHHNRSATGPTRLLHRSRSAPPDHLCDAGKLNDGKGLKAGQSQADRTFRPALDRLARAAPGGETPTHANLGSGRVGSGVARGSRLCAYLEAKRGRSASWVRAPLAKRAIGTHPGCESTLRSVLGHRPCARSRGTRRCHGPS